MSSSIALYLEYEKKMQRAGLFKLLSNLYEIRRAMYPGSYIHISPSFYFPEAVYIDTDSKAKKFFKDDSTSYVHKSSLNFSQRIPRSSATGSKKREGGQGSRDGERGP